MKSLNKDLIANISTSIGSLAFKLRELVCLCFMDAGALGGEKQVSESQAA